MMDLIVCDKFNILMIYMYTSDYDIVAGGSVLDFWSLGFRFESTRGMFHH